MASILSRPLCANTVPYVLSGSRKQFILEDWQWPMRQRQRHIAIEHETPQHWPPTVRLTIFFTMTAKKEKHGALSIMHKASNRITSRIIESVRSLKCYGCSENSLGPAALLPSRQSNLKAIWTFWDWIPRGFDISWQGVLSDFKTAPWVLYSAFNI